MNKYLAEAIGTFCLVFCGTGAIVINEISAGVITHTGIAITFGLVVMAMIYTFGHISGAHLNPAVTLGFAFSGRFAFNKVMPYILAQTGGAVIASSVLRLLFPENMNLGATLPSGTIIQSFGLEVILTYILMLVIINVSQGAREVGIMAGIAVGGTVGLEAMFAGPVSGASMNPARSLAPALLSGQTDALWIYLLAPVAGAILAIYTWRGMRQAEVTPAP